MRVTGGIISILAAAAMTGCVAEAPLGPPQYISARVEQMSDEVFAVGIEGKNVDEYAYARCVAANYAKHQETAAFAELAGEPLHTRFLKQDGMRVLHSYGVLQFTVATAGDEAPPLILPVRETLAECGKNGIPTGFTAVKVKRAAG